MIILHSSYKHLMILAIILQTYNDDLTIILQTSYDYLTIILVTSYDSYNHLTNII
jgi:hypothetical protein